MTYVPVTPPPAPSPRAQELSRLLTETIDGFRRDHPGMTGTEIRQALSLATSPDSTKRRAMVIALALGLLLFGLLIFFYQSRGGSFEGGQPWVLVAIGVFSIVGVAVAALRNR